MKADDRRGIGSVLLRTVPTKEASIPWWTVQQALAEGTDATALGRLLRSLDPEGDVVRERGVHDGGYLVKRSVLFPGKPSQYELSIGTADRNLAAASVTSREVGKLADLIRAQDWDALCEIFRCSPIHARARRARVKYEPVREWQPPKAPGIYRREHASLLIRSRSTSILLDPLTLCGNSLPHIGMAPTTSSLGPIDAIAITHGHGDHWQIASILAAAGHRDLPVLVPAVPRINLLTKDAFGAVLRDCGQACRELRWGKVLRVGDIDMEVLPFYGEQPTRDAPGADRLLRNWGNCYRFTAEDFTCLVLADAGIDPSGSIVDAVAASSERFGPVDVVLACQREFASPFFGGLSTYWAALTYDQLRALHDRFSRGGLPSTTAGVEGAVRACIASKARRFLPYANGYEGPGRPITDIGWGLGEPSEADASAVMNAAFRRARSSTRALRWNPGDAALFDRRELHWRRWRAAATRS